MTMEYMEGMSPEVEMNGDTVLGAEDTQQPAVDGGEGAPENGGAWYEDDKTEDWPPGEGPWPSDVVSEAPPDEDDSPGEEQPPSDDGDSVVENPLPDEDLGDVSESPEEPDVSGEARDGDEASGQEGEASLDSGGEQVEPPPEESKKITRRRAAAKSKGPAPPAAPRKRATSRRASAKADPEPVAEEPKVAPPPGDPAPDPEAAAERDLAERRRLAAQQRQTRRREREYAAILDVDGTSLVEDSDGFDEKAAAVYQAANTRSICCGSITGVKYSRGSGHYVEAEYKGFRVLIPFQEMDIVLERQPADSDNDYENKTITAIRNMVGAEIEFIILDIDANEQLAIASRRQATEYRRRTVLNGTTRDGEFIIYPTRQVKARVLDVHPFYAWVEVAGWRTRLSASELRAEFVEDMTTELANGQRVTVTIKELTRDRRGNVTDMRISMRDDEKEKRDLEKAVAAINIGDIIRCEVVGRSSKVIRLKTHNGARAFCYIAKGLHGRYIPKIDESVTIKVIKKTENPRTGNPVIQGNILRRSVKPGLL